MNDLQKEARYWQQQKVAVIPIAWKRKNPEIEWLRHVEFLPTSLEIRSWFATRLHNIAVVTGWENLVVIDFDDGAKFEEWRQWADSSNIREFALKTRIVKSTRGAHVYAYTERACGNMKLDGIDILADRKYVLAPPSIHPSGINYEFINEADPVAIESIESVLPVAWLENAVESKRYDPSIAIPSGAVALSQDDYLRVAGADKTIAGNSRTLIAEIKSLHRIEDMFSNVHQSKNARWLMTKCPFHDDVHDSFWIDVDAQLCGCFAGCTKRSLDVIGLYARINNISNGEAIERLRTNE